MRISDWSSDVCSSDLSGSASDSASPRRAIQASKSAGVRALIEGKAPIAPARQTAVTSSGLDTLNIGAAISGSLRRCLSSLAVRHSQTVGRISDIDRKRVVLGKRVSDRLALWVRRTIKQKKNNN